MRMPNGHDIFPDSIPDAVNKGMHFVPKEDDPDFKLIRINRKNILKILCGVMAAILLFLIVQANSLHISMLFAGLDTGEMEYIVTEEKIKDKYLQDKEYSVFVTKTWGGDGALVYAETNFLGFWKLSLVQKVTEEQSAVSVAWKMAAGARQFTEGDNIPDESEWNFVISGSNATKEIAFEPGQLPENSTVNIRQDGANYTVHLIVFSPGKVNVDLYGLLAQNGCVPAK